MKDEESGFQRRPGPITDASFDRGGAQRGAPGKRTATQGVQRPADPATIILGHLRDAEAALGAVTAQHLPAMRAAIGSRQMPDARRAGSALTCALDRVDRSLDTARRYAAAMGSDGARSLLAPLEAQRDAIRADAAPVLALAPPPAPVLPVSAAFDPLGQDWEQHDAAEAANAASWNAQLDAPPDNVIDASDRFGAVQLRGAPLEDAASIQRHAAAGVAGAGGPLPHLDAIQASFGAHDVTGVHAHVGGAAADASAAIGAEAYATGDHVAFAGSPSLFVAAHEAAHVVQQRAGVSLLGGVGQAGDTYEQQADAVAEKVVRGESAEGLLGGVQKQFGTTGVQRKESPEHDFLILQLDAVAADCAAALDRIESYEDDESPAESVAHVKLAAETALSDLTDRLNNIAAVAPAATGKPLERAARRAASALAELLDAARGADASVDVERDVASSTMAAFGINLAATTPGATDATFTSKERKRSIAAALEAAEARLSHARKRDPQVDLDAVYGLLNQAETDLRRARPKNVKTLVKAISKTVSGYSSWASSVELDEVARASIGMVTSALDGIRAQLGMPALSASRSASKPNADRAKENLTASDVITTVANGDVAVVDDPETNIEKIGGLLGMVWKAQETGIEQAGEALDEINEAGHDGGWIETLLVAAASLAISGGTGALGELLKKKLITRAASDVVATGVADIAKEAMASSAKAAVKAMIAFSETIRSGNSHSAEEGAEPDRMGSLPTARTAKNLYVRKQTIAAQLSQGRAESTFADLKVRLRDADPAHLSDLRKELAQLVMEGTGFYEQLIVAQEHQTLLEWINFKARWYLGGDDKRRRDVDSDSRKLEHHGSALSLHGSPGILDITAVFPKHHPEREPDMFRIALHDMEPRVKDMLRDPRNGYRLGDLKVNRLLRLEVHDNTAEFLDTPVLVTASGQIHPKCTDAATLIWKAFVDETKLVYLMGELDERVEDDPSIADRRHAIRGAKKFLEKWADLALENLQ